MTHKVEDRIFTLANFFSIARILLTPVFLIMVLNHKATGALIIFSLAALTDFLDGTTARFLNQKTKLGAYLDPAGDKFLMTASFIILTIPSLNLYNIIPLWLTIAIIGRDLLIVTGAFIIYKLKGQKTFNPSILGKASTVCQMAVLFFILLLNSIHISSPLLSWLFVITLLLTILSGIQYSFTHLRRISASNKK